MTATDSTFSIIPSKRRAQLQASIQDISDRLNANTVVLSTLQQSLPSAKMLATLGTFEAQNRILNTLRLLRPMRVDSYNKARFGCQHDGGYVMLNDLSKIQSAISLGVEANASWDESVADQGIKVFQFDHSIAAPPVFRPDLVFIKKRIAAVAGSDVVTLDELASEYTQGENSSILKMDIEHDEWPVFDAASDEALRCFSQIVVEFHGFGAFLDAGWQKRAQRVFEKLHRHFAVIHVHANNHCGINSVANVAVPEVLEISFVSRARYKLAESYELFPGLLDTPNNPDVADIHIGTFHF